MGADMEILPREVIVFDLNSASADCLLKRYPPGIFFVGKQFVNCFPVPSGPASGGGDTLPFQPGSNLPQTITGKILLKYPAHYLRLIGIHCQLTIRINIISIALAPAFCHFGAAVLKPFPEAGLNGFAFLYHIHYNAPSTNENTAVKLLRC